MKFTLVKKKSTLLLPVLTIMVTGLFPTLFSPQIANAFSCRDLVDAPIAASDGKGYVTWPTNKSGNLEVMFRASEDAGKTFGDKINLSTSPGVNSISPDIRASGDNVYVSFLDARNGPFETYVRTSNDAGKTFGPMIKINGTNGTVVQESEVRPPDFDPVKESQENTRIATSGENVYVTSWDMRTGNWEVFLSTSNDNGQTFGGTINLSNTTNAKSDRAWIEAEGDNVYVSWWETQAPGKQEPVIRVSNDNGQTFGPTLNLGDNGTIGSSPS